LELDPELEVAAIGLMEVHNHMESYEPIENDGGAQFSNAQFAAESSAPPSPKLDARLTKPAAQTPPPRQRIVNAQTQPARAAPAAEPKPAVRIPRPTNSADRLLAAIKRPVQLPGRAESRDQVRQIKRLG